MLVGWCVLFYLGWSGIDVLLLLVYVCVIGDMLYDWLFLCVVMVMYYGGLGIMYLVVWVGILLVVVLFVGD